MERTHIDPLRAAALVGAPLAAVVGRLLGTPWLEDPTEYLTEVGRHTGRSDLGAMATLVSALLFIPAVLTLAALVRRRHPRTGRVGGALAVVGAVAMAAVACVSLAAGQMARLDDRATMAELWDRIITEPPLQVFPLMLAAGAAGAIVLAVGLHRGGSVPRPAAVLAGLGGAATMVTGGAPVRVVMVAVAAVALAGYAWIAVAATPAEAAEADEADQANQADTDVGAVVTGTGRIRG